MAFTLSPAPADEQAFSDGLAGVGLSGGVDGFGIAVVETQNGVQFAVRFGNFANHGPAANQFQAGTTSFSFQAVDPAAHTYTILVSYTTGDTQLMRPAVHDMTGFANLLTGLGIGYQIYASGHVDLLNTNGNAVWRGMPDLALRAAQTGILAPTVTPAGDVDGNGLADFEYLTPAGSQYIFAVDF